jgi:uncharacterized protein YjbI with pentapeptide repeats
MRSRVPRWAALAAGAALCITSIPPLSAAAQTAATLDCPSAYFGHLAQTLTMEVVGGCLEAEHVIPNGNIEQRTANGLLYLRKCDNLPIFTDGNLTWLDGPYDVMSRLNSDAPFDFETPDCPGPAPDTQQPAIPEPPAPVAVACDGMGPPNLRLQNQVNAERHWASMPNVYLELAKLDGADFTGADLSCGSLVNASASKAIFAHANLSRVTGVLFAAAQGDFQRADLTQARLSLGNLNKGDFRDAVLRGADLSRANLSGADLSGADLCGADLSQVDLRNANLTGVRGAFNGRSLSQIGVQLTGAIGVPITPAGCPDGPTPLPIPLPPAASVPAECDGLGPPNLRLATLTNVDRHSATMANAYLELAKLDGADFSAADLSCASVVNASAKNAAFVQANLTNLTAVLFTASQANFEGANLTQARLSQANLTKADLRGAVLRGADLTRANLAGADLRGADLCGADLTQADLSGANLFGIQGAYRNSLDRASVRLNGAIGVPSSPGSC